LQFINDCTEETTTHIKTTEIYETFKVWFKINNPNVKIPSNREFLSNIKKYKTVTHIKVNNVPCYGIIVQLIIAIPFCYDILHIHIHGHMNIFF